MANSPPPLDTYIYLKRPKAAYPSWIPVEGPQWRLIDTKGNMLRDSDGYSLRFHTDEEALEWMRRHKVALLPPKY